MRRREKQVESDELPSKLYQFFEKQRIKRSTIRKIKDENEQSASTEEDIANISEEEYTSERFKSKTSAIAVLRKAYATAASKGSKPRGTQIPVTMAGRRLKNGTRLFDTHKCIN